MCIWPGALYVSRNIDKLRARFRASLQCRELAHASPCPRTPRAFLLVETFSARLWWWWWLCALPHVNAVVTMCTLGPSCNHRIHAGICTWYTDDAPARHSVHTPPSIYLIERPIVPKDNERIRHAWYRVNTISCPYLRDKFKALGKMCDDVREFCGSG